MVSRVKHDFLPSLEENDFLPPLSRWTTRGSLLLVAAVAILSQHQRDYRDRQITSKAEVEEAQANLKLAQDELEETQLAVQQQEKDVESQLANVERQISQDTIKPQDCSFITSLVAKKNNNKEAEASRFYEVTIEPETLVLGKEENLCKIELGMEGRADIITREETFLKFLLRKARLITEM